MTVAMATQSGELHGLINTIGNSVAFDDFKHMSAEAKAKVKKEQKEDSRVVKARYLHKRGNNERLDKPYCRYAGDAIKIYHLIPGYVYELPMGFVKEVNACKEIKRSGLVSVDGESLNVDGSPTNKDTFGEGLHQLIPTTFA